MKSGTCLDVTFVAMAVLGCVAALPTTAGAQLLSDQSSAAAVQSAGSATVVTFTKDVAPILQANCQACHRAGGAGPMSLLTYDEVRPWAHVIKFRTGLRDRAGAMPPYYLERGIGIQHYKDDERLTEEEIRTLAAWADGGAERGNPEDMPPPIDWPEAGVWVLGEPDLITRTEEFFMAAGDPDWWGEMPSVPVGLDEDRYVRAVAIREVNSVVGESARGTSVGGRWIVHHMIWSTRLLDDAEEQNDQAASEEGGATGWPVHELGRNPDIFDPRAGRLLRAGSHAVSNSVHLHSSGQDTRAHLEIGWYFHPEGYTPEYRSGGFSLGDGMNIDIRGGQDQYQELHAFAVLNDHVKISSFEPHLHGPGARMCLQAVWGSQIETLSCSGYDHNWVKQYTYAEGYEPLLPKGTVVHLVGYMDMSQTSPNVPDPRNWQGSGNRSITNMFIDLGNRVRLTDEQFVQEMADRRERFNLGPNDHVIGCPLCMANIPPFPRAAANEEPAEAGAAASNDNP
jgi:mono/diheme cytochrome c family protein